MSLNTKRRADLFMLLITLIWSGTFVIIKNALDEVPPCLSTGLRFALASLIGYALWFRSMRGITKKEVFQGSVLGIFFGLGFLSQTWGLQHTTVANSSFITGSMAIFTPIAAYLIDKRTVSKYQVLGIFIVLTGLAFFSQHGFDEWQFNVGDAATLFCAVMWGMYITYTDKFMRDAKNIAISSAAVLENTSACGLAPALIRSCSSALAVYKPCSAIVLLKLFLVPQVLICVLGIHSDIASVKSVSKIHTGV